MDHYPPNSKHPRRRAAADKKVERITSAAPVRRKKPLGKQFADTFVAGDAKSAMHFVLFSVLIPSAKDAIAEAASQGIEKLIFGESRKRKAGPPSGNTGFVSYNRFAQASQHAAPQGISKRARANHDFEEIVLSSRAEASDVVDRLFDLVSQYESASVADLYTLVGLESTHTDQKWGWFDLTGASAVKVRGGNGYLIDLPEPEPLD